MKRYIANYTIVPHQGIFINHIITLDDNGMLIGLKPADEELAYTIYVPGTNVLVPQAFSKSLTQLINGLTTRHDIYSALTEATKPYDLHTQPLSVLTMGLITD